MQNKIIRTTISLQSDEWKAIKLAAINQQTTASALLRKAIKNIIAGQSTSIPQKMPKLGTISIGIKSHLHRHQIYD